MSCVHGRVWKVAVDVWYWLPKRYPWGKDCVLLGFIWNTKDSFSTLEIIYYKGCATHEEEILKIYNLAGLRTKYIQHCKTVSPRQRASEDLKASSFQDKPAFQTLLKLRGSFLFRDKH